MSRYRSEKQRTLDRLATPFQAQGIRFTGNPRGRPKKLTEGNRKELQRLKPQWREEYLHRSRIEGKFGQGKNCNRRNYIRAQGADTSVAWIKSIFFAMNPLVLLSAFLVLCGQGAATIFAVLHALAEHLKVCLHSARPLRQRVGSWALTC